MELSSYAARHRLGDCHAVQATERVEQLVRRAKGRVRLAAEDPLSMSGHRLRRIVAVRSGGRWTDVGTLLVREGLRAVVADMDGVGPEPDVLRARPGGARRRPRGLRPGRVRRRPERRLAAEAVGQLGCGRP